MVQSWSEKRFRILVAILMAAGFTQGLLIPLLSTLLEQQGVSSSINGLNTAALYLGILLFAPISGWLVPRWGYRKVIVTGVVMATVAFFLFPLTTSMMAWVFLRFIVGSGDSMLHYATGLWITSTCPSQIRGRRISQYGLSYGLGFGLGPLGINLLSFGQWVPFVVMGMLLVGVLALAMMLEAGAPPTEKKEQRDRAQLGEIYRLGLVALCPAILYGFLEACLSGSFPVYGLREGLSTAWISALLSAFVWGSLLFQIPLGILSDRFGRKQVLMTVCTLGAVGMSLVPFFMGRPTILLVLFALTGGLIGSLFSLGLAFLSDILPPSLLPEANAIATAHFSVGSMVGPYIGGTLIQYWGGGSMFYFLAFALLAFVLLALFYRPSGKAGSHVASKAA